MARRSIARLTHICIKCGQEKPRADFDPREDRPWAVKARCRECLKDAPYKPHKKFNNPRPKMPEVERRERKLATCRKSSKQWRKNNPEKYKEINSRYRPGLAAWARKDRSSWSEEDRQMARINARHRWMRKYGITLEQFEFMSKAQNNLCAICKRTSATSNPNFDRLLVDHCHTTQRIRGLLCSHCNCALGLVGDDPLILTAMIDYLLTAKSSAIGALVETVEDT